MNKKEKKNSVEKESKTTGSRVTFIIGVVLCVILVPILIINCTLIINGFVTDRPPSIFGYTPLVVLTDSMDPLIAEGDVIFTKTVNPDEIKVGDVISFFDPASPDDAVLTHRVIAIETDEDGNRSAITAGDNNANRDYERDKILAKDTPEGSEEKLRLEKAQIVEDANKPGYEYVVYGGGKDAEGKEIPFEHRDSNPVPLTDKEIIGIYSYSGVPAVGKFVMFMQGTWGWIICIAVPLIAFLAYELITRKKKDKSKEKDMDALLAELEALKAAKAAAEGTNVSTDAEANETAETAENDSSKDADDAPKEE